MSLVLGVWDTIDSVSASGIISMYEATQNTKEFRNFGANV
jgi:hypothetical protein